MLRHVAKTQRDGDPCGMGLGAAFTAPKDRACGGGGGTAEPIKPGFTPEILDFLHPTQPSCQFFLALGRSGGGRGPTRREKGGAAGAGGFLPD